MAEEKDLATLTEEELLAAMDADERADGERRAAAAKTRKLERFKLKKRFEKELRGVEGFAFAIIEIPTAFGADFIVLRKPEGVLVKALSDGEKSNAEVDAFLQRICVYPKPEEMTRIIDDRVGAGGEIFTAAMGLAGASASATGKK